MNLFIFLIVVGFGIVVAAKSFTMSELILLGQLSARVIAWALRTATDPAGADKHDFLIAVASLCLISIILSHMAFIMVSKSSTSAAAATLSLTCALGTRAITVTNAIHVIFYESVRDSVQKFYESFKFLTAGMRRSLRIGECSATGLELLLSL